MDNIRTWLRRLLFWLVDEGVYATVLRETFRLGAR